MILARCPACGTTFRVRPEQLQARAGRVRCGQCNHAFNALEARVEHSPLDHENFEPPPPPAQPEPQPAVATTSLFVLEEKTPEEAPPAEIEAEEPAAAGFDPFAETPADAAPAPPLEEPLEEPAFSAEDDDAPPPGAVFELPAPEAPPDVDERIEPAFDLDTEPLDEWPAVDIDIDIDTGDKLAPAPFAADPADAPPVIEPLPFQPDWPAAADLDLTTPIDEAIDFDALLRKSDPDETAPRPLASAPEEQPWPGSSTELEIKPFAAPAAALVTPVPAAHARSADTAPPRPEALPAEPENSPEDGPEEDADDTESTSGPALRQAAWAAGATLLSLALLAQGVLMFRAEIVQSSPQMRPFMESLCAGLGCELPLPRDSAEIAIESSDIQPDAGREAFFTLHATLRNRADFQQAYPYLEITLTDARDKALVRKVLEPKEWLPSSAPKDAFPAKRELVTRVSFEAPGVAAAGYRVYVFYP